MQIGGVIASYSALAASRLGREAPAAGSTAAAPVADRGGGVSSYDFSHMTPREMQSAVRGLIKSGQLSLVEAGNLICMAPMPMDGSSPVSAPTFDQPMDYLNRIKQGVQFYKSTGDRHNAEHWSRLLDKLQSLQGAPSGVNELV
jgi:hypothetical protein